MAKEFIVSAVLLVGCCFVQVSGVCEGTCVPFGCDDSEKDNNGPINENDKKPTFDLSFGGFDGDCEGVFEVCCKSSSIGPARTPAPVSSLTCGNRNADGIGFRILESELGESQYGEFPWTLMILYFDEPKYVSVGSASLIKPGVALTAAHIIAKANGGDLIARAGEWDSNRDNELFPVQEASVSNFIIHENFNSNLKYDNNIALLVLDKPFDLVENVQLVCLPPPNFPYGDGICVTGGWGKIRFGDKSTTNILKRVQLPIVDRYECQDALRTTRLGPSFQLDESYICAGGQHEIDACTGDGGAALACPDASGQYYQVGIVAWGAKCGVNNIPSAHTNVPMFSGWIQEKLNSLPRNLL